MKQKSTYLTVILLTVFCFNINNLTAGGKVSVKYPEPEVSAKVAPLTLDNVRYSKNINKTQANFQFIVFDSLANVYSYGNMMTNKAIKYEPYTSTIVTVKRGFIDNDRYPNYTGSNTKNNLFVRYSNTWGKTWEPAKVLYDKNIYSFDEARYPSCYPFEFEGSLAVAFNAPRVIEKQSVWTGHLLGFWSNDYGSVPVKQAKIVKNRTGLEWSTDSRVLAGPLDGGESFYHFILSRISPTDEQDVNNANHIGFIKTVDLDENSTQVVPQQWESSNFRTAQAGYRSNEIVDLKKDYLDNFYFAAFGGFTSLPTTKNSVGISISTDKGDNWSDFKVMPWSIANNFIMAKGHPSDSANFVYDNKSFVVYENGETVECSFAVKLLAWGTGTTKTYVVELIYTPSTNTWRINEIAGDIGSYILYQDILDNNNQRTNWNDHELEITRTVDGRHLLVKWVGIIGFNPDDNTFETTDIFTSIRNTSTNVWQTPTNITNSDELDRMTMLPDYIPDNLIDIPIFKMVTVTSASMTDTEKYNEQFYGGKDQYLVVGHFNQSVGVLEEEEPCDCKQLQIQKICPNPIVGDGTIAVTIFMPEENHADISLYDASGRLIDDLKEYDGTYKFQASTINIDLSNRNLPTGAYYINLIGCGQKTTKMFTVVK